MCKSGNFVCGLFLGAIIGSAVGILAAPESGEQTRKKIKDQTEDVLDGVNNQFKEYADTLKDQFATATDGLNEKMNQYKTQLENKIQEIQNEVNQDIADLNEELEHLHNEEEVLKQNAETEEAK